MPVVVTAAKAPTLVTLFAHETPDRPDSDGARRDLRPKTASDSGQACLTSLTLVRAVSALRKPDHKGGCNAPDRVSRRRARVLWRPRADRGSCGPRLQRQPESCPVLKASAPVRRRHGNLGRADGAVDLCAN